MNPLPPSTPRRSRLLRAGIAVASSALVAGSFSLIADQPTAYGRSPESPIKLIAATSQVTLQSYEGEVQPDFGVYAVAGRKPLEIRTYRPSYDNDIGAFVVLPGADRPLPQGLIKSFAGLTKFSTITVTDRAGKRVTLKQTFCPNGGVPVRYRPDAPARSPYPTGCGGDSANPYTLGAVWGVQAGYGVPLAGYDSPALKLKPGKYTVKITIDPAYQKALKINSGDATATVGLTVVKGEDGEHRSKALAQQRSQESAPAPVKPKGKPAKPSGPLPDLRSLPAWGVAVDAGRYLAFSATVWNAGPSPLLVDGFRRPKDEKVMDAYQYFLDRKGKQVGYAPVGTMEWDARDGHEHWHFTDFASYRLLDANKKLVLRSQKEAFCLANTDAVDYTVPGANWKPENTDLHTACGDRSSLGVREVLETGSGDTYQQFLPGQSFDLKGLKNGVYYIEVRANPDRKLYENDLGNNVSYRKVIIGGTAGHRTVVAEKVGRVVEPPVDIED